MNFRKLLVKIPFTYRWYIKVFCDNPDTILDVGCGDGELMESIAQRCWKITGIDIFGKSLKIAKKRGVYIKLIEGDILIKCEELVKKNQKFDLVFCSQIIEHLKKQEGEKLLVFLEHLAKKRIYISTPRNFMNQLEDCVEENPHQYHKSGWTEKDFKKRGYKIYGIGFDFIWSEKGVARSKNKLLKIVSYIFSFIISPAILFLPRYSTGIIAIKDI